MTRDLAKILTPSFARILAISEPDPFPFNPNPFHTSPQTTLFLTKSLYSIRWSIMIIILSAINKAKPTARIPPTIETITTQSGTGVGHSECAKSKYQDAHFF